VRRGVWRWLGVFVWVFFCCFVPLCRVSIVGVCAMVVLGGCIKIILFWFCRLFVRKKGGGLEAGGLRMKNGFFY
jgi:hypothetical protein